MAEPRRAADPRRLKPARRGQHLGARARRALGALSRRPQPRAAPGGGDTGRPGAGAGRRRHRQDPGADHAHRPHHQHGAGAPFRDPGGDLHQQGGAGDEDAGRADDGPGGRGHAVARDLSFHRRQGSATARRAGEPQVRLHHPRRRRPDPRDEAAAGRRGHRREALAGARARDADRRLEEPRARPPTWCRPAKPPPSPTARARSSTPPISSG